MIGGIDHEGDRGPGRRIGEEAAQTGAVDARIADDDVGDASIVQSECFEKGERENTGEGRMGQGTFDRRQGAQGFRGDTDRQSVRAVSEGVEVGV